MSHVLLNDFNPKASQMFTNILNGRATITEESYDEQKKLTGYDLVALYADHGEDQTVLEKVKSLYYRTRFRNIPIILIKDRAELFAEEPYLNFGLSDFISLDDPQPVVQHILQGYLNPSRQPLDREMVYLSPFIESTKKVVEKMASLKAELKGIYFKNHLRIVGDVSGVMGLSGTIEGTLVITFRWGLAQQVISGIMGVGPNEIDAEMIHDGTGEILNMIGGSAKKSLTKASYDFQLSLPTVIVGCGHEAGHPKDAAIAVLVFDVEDESFVLHVSLASKV